MKHLSSLFFLPLLVLSIAVACSDSDSTGNADGDVSRDGGGGDSCTLKHHQECDQDTTYWVDSCGNRGDVAALCDCGCNQDLNACESACACTPDCDGKDCGDDGCGDVCGECQGATTCNTAGLCVGEQTPDQLTLGSCSAPYVLDASKVTDVIYMTSHFDHLIQQYCISGTFGGQDITAFPEKMVYGQHNDGDVVSLVQVSMTASLAPTWSVKLDFSPDTAFTTGSAWKPAVTGSATLQVSVALLKHEGTTVCVQAVGNSGEVSVVAAQDCTLVEGGSFEIQGTVGLVDPHGVGNFCSRSSVPCCS